MHVHVALIKMECTKIFSPCEHFGLCASISFQKPNLGILREVGRETSSGLAGSLGICSVLSHLSALPSTCVNVHANSVPMATQASNSTLLGQFSTHWAIASAP